MRIQSGSSNNSRAGAPSPQTRLTRPPDWARSTKDSAGRRPGTRRIRLAPSPSAKANATMLSE